MPGIKIKRLVVGDLGTNCYILVSGPEAAVVDPGGDPEIILRETEKENVFLKYIINTHYHPDHISANGRVKEKTGAEILIHEGERDFIGFEPDQFLKEGDVIKIGNDALFVLHTPGHSKGSICLLGEGFAIVGDLLFESGFGRTDLPGGSREDIENSLEKLKKTIKPGTKIFPGHDEIFIIS